MYNSVTITVFIVSCNHHHSLVPKHFHHPERKPLPALSSSFHRPLLAMNLLSISMALNIRGFCVNGILQFVRPFISLFFHHVFEVHPCCSMYENFIPFMAEWYSTAWIDHICLCSHHVMDIWVVSTSWAIVNSAAKEFVCHLIICFQFFWEWHC